MKDRTTFTRVALNLYRNRATGMILRKNTASDLWQLWQQTRDGVELLWGEYYFTTARKLAKEYAAREIRLTDRVHTEALAEKELRGGTMCPAVAETRQVRKVCADEFVSPWAREMVAWGRGEYDAEAEQVVEAEQVAEAPAAKHATREVWLTEAVDALRPIFAEVGEDIPAVRVSVGWPGGRGKKNAVIGQCWPTGAAGDKVAQVFVSPVLDDASAVLATLAHELVHAVDDCASGHKGRFAKVAKGIGLTGKMTATHAGDELAAKLATIADDLGAYPHAKLAQGGGAGEKKQTTRMIKCECDACGYTARTTRKWLDEVGAPLCPCNREEMTVCA